MAEFSFIVPVYNCEKYLNECVDSILSQTCKDFDVWLIDDGSGDSSGKICDLYSSEYDFVNVIHKENAGPSHTRNTGIENCFGKYIWFIDSDDKLSSNTALEKIHSITQKTNADAVYFLSREYNADFSKEIRKGAEFSVDGLFEMCGEEFLCMLDKENVLEAVATSPVNKVFKRSLFIDNNIRFVEKFRCFEEDELLCKTAFYGKSFYILNDYLYDVRIRENSVSTTVEYGVTERKLNYRLELVDMCCEFYRDNGKNKKFISAMYKFYSYYYLFSLNDYFKLNDTEQKKKIKMNIKKYNSIFNYMKLADSKYLRLISFMYKLLGINAVLKFIKR